MHGACSLYYATNLNWGGSSHLADDDHHKDANEADAELIGDCAPQCRLIHIVRPNAGAARELANEVSAQGHQEAVKAACPGQIHSGQAHGLNDCGLLHKVCQSSVSN